MPDAPISNNAKIAVLEKQIDRLRKEVDDRMGSNHTLWRAGLAGLGALILLKEALDLSRLSFVAPIIAMTLASHWINQTLTFFRAGDAMAVCERRINVLAGDVLLTHELSLTLWRIHVLRRLRWPYVLLAVTATGLYWWVVMLATHALQTAPGTLLWTTTHVVAALANAMALGNLWRLLRLNWTSAQRLTGDDERLSRSAT